MNMFEKLSRKLVILAAIFSLGILVTGCETMGTGGKSVEELTAAAEAGDGNASLKLGDHYFKEKNYAESEKWYQKAAQQFQGK